MRDASKTTREWRLDVVTRAVAFHAPEGDAQRAVMAQLLGVHAWAPAPGRFGSETETPGPPIPPPEPVAPSRTPPVPTAPTASSVTPGAVEDSPPDRLRLYPLPPRDLAERPHWYEVTSPLPTPQLTAAPPVAPPLLPQARARSVLSAALKVAPDARHLDLRAVLRAMTSVKPLRHLPLLPSWRLTPSVHLVLDRGAAMAPFGQDARALRRDLGKLLGEGRLFSDATDGWPPDLGDPPYRGAVLLLVSGLGLLPGGPTFPEARAADWASFARAATRRGWRPIALTPADPALWPVALTRALAMVHWAETTNARQARSAVMGGRPRYPSPPSAGLETLAQLAAMTARLDLAGLRRLRRLAGGGPELEARLWWSDHVDSRGGTGITLGDAARAALHEGFAARPDSAPLLAALQAQRADLPAQFAFEETATQMLVARPDGWQEALRAHLRAGVRTVLEGGPAARGFALWMLKMLPRLDVPSDLTEEAAALYFAACQQTGAVARREAAPGALPAPSWLSGTRPATGPTVTAALQWDGAGLRMTPVQALRIAVDAALSAELTGLADQVTWATISPDGQKLAVCFWNGEVFVQDAVHSAAIQLPPPRQTGMPFMANHIRFSADLTRLYCHSGDGIYEFDLRSGQDLGKLEDELGLLYGKVEDAPDGRQRAKLRLTGEIEIEDMATGTTIAMLHGEKALAGDKLLFSRDGRQLIVATEETLFCYDLDRLGAAPGKEWMMDKITVLSWAGRDDQVLVGYDTGAVDVVALDDLRPVQRFDAGPIETGPTDSDLDRSVKALAAPRGQDWAVLGLEDGRVIVFNTRTGFEVVTWGLRPSMDSLSIDDAGQRLVIAHGGISVYDIDLSPAEDAHLRPETEFNRDPYRRGPFEALLWPAAPQSVQMRQGEARWLRARPDGDRRRARTLALGGTPKRLGAAAWVDLEGPGSQEFRLEDVAAADARRPLSLAVIVHPQDMQRALPVMDALEDRLRAHAGLPDTAPVLQRLLAERETGAAAAFEDALRRAQGAAGAVLFGSAMLNDDVAVQAGDRLAEIFGATAMPIEIVSYPNHERDLYLLFNAISRVHSGDLRWRDVERDPFAAESGSATAVYVVPIRKDLREDPDYCAAVQRFVGAVHAQGTGQAVLPVDLDGALQEGWLETQIPALLQYQVWTHDPASSTDTPEDQIAQQAVALARVKGNAALVPIALEDSAQKLGFYVDGAPDWWATEWWASDRVDAAARHITDHWRHGLLEPTERLPQDDLFDYGLAVCKMMQDLTLSFHVGRFNQRLDLRSREVPLSEFGLSETLDTETDISPERRRFEHFMFLAEYFHAGPVSEYLRTGADPWQRYDPARVMQALEYELIGEYEENPDTPEIDLGPIWQGFAHHAAPQDRAEMRRILGRPDLPDQYRWRDMLDEATSARIHAHGRGRVVALLAPFAAPGMGHYAIVPSPDAPPHSIVEEIERDQGQFLAYLRALYGAHPRLTVFVPVKDWQMLGRMPEGRLTACLARAMPDLLDRIARGDEAEVSVATFHDIAAVLAEEVAMMVRWRSRQPVGSAAMA